MSDIATSNTAPGEEHSTTPDEADASKGATPREPHDDTGREDIAAAERRHAARTKAEVASPREQAVGAAEAKNAARQEKSARKATAGEQTVRAAEAKHAAWRAEAARTAEAKKAARQEEAARKATAREQAARAAEAREAARRAEAARKVKAREQAARAAEAEKAARRDEAARKARAATVQKQVARDAKEAASRARAARAAGPRQAAAPGPAAPRREASAWDDTAQDASVARRQRPPQREVVHKPRRALSLRTVPLRTHLDMAGHFGHNYVKKYYLDTFLGLLWLPLRPLVDVLMRSLLFGAFLQVSSGGRPYLIFLSVGSIGWFFFERVTYWGYRSLQYNYRYFRTIPVPWLPAVTGTVVPGAVQALLYSLIAAGIAVYYYLTRGEFYLSLGASAAYALLGLVLLLLYSWMLGLFLAPLVRVARDVRLFVPYPLMFLYVITPVVYTVESMPEQYRAIAVYNPLTAPIEFIRHGLLDMGLPEAASILTSAGVLAVTIPIALLLFARAEQASHRRL